MATLFDQVRLDQPTGARVPDGEGKGDGDAVGDASPDGVALAGTVAEGDSDRVGVGPVISLAVGAGVGLGDVASPQPARRIDSATAAIAGGAERQSM